MAINIDGHPVEAVRRFHSALRELADRRGIRNEVSRYEAIALALASTRTEHTGTIIDEFPAPGSPLRFERFFGSLYRQYDERFVYAAPDLKRLTARREWDRSSIAFSVPTVVDLNYEPRVSS